MTDRDTSNTPVGTWSLNETTKEAQSAELMLTTASEAALTSDHRTLVDVNDIKDGKKYRCKSGLDN
jgi:hypothetical protein